ncbi:MAG: nitroreductase [Anaerofustis stercorihominis]|nr:nitroreductase [Anaerofustis stercorihominis]
MNFSAEKTIRNRISVRTYDKKEISAEIRTQIMAFADSLQNPLGPKINFRLLDKNTSEKGEKLGTYGIIKGAKLYIGATVPEHENALEALGYDFEKLMLYLKSLGLGTCWLGGTFNKGAFAEAMQVEDGHIFPIVSPVGYPAAKMSLTEKIMRKGAKADRRLPWSELFYKDKFGTALAEEDAGEYAKALEMVRLAPSAVNRQPWRIVMKDGAFHFYQANVKPEEEKEAVDMHRIDAGIAVCHFDLTVQEMGIEGEFVKDKPEDTGAPENADYIVSWIPKNIL